MLVQTFGSFVRLRRATLPDRHPSSRSTRPRSAVRTVRWRLPSGVTLVLTRVTVNDPSSPRVV